MKRQGAVGNKLMSFHSDMSAVRHIDMGFYSEVIVSSGLKTEITVASKMVQF